MLIANLIISEYVCVYTCLIPCFGLGRAVGCQTCPAVIVFIQPTLLSAFFYKYLQPLGLQSSAPLLSYADLLMHFTVVQGPHIQDVWGINCSEEFL